MVKEIVTYYTDKQDQEWYLDDNSITGDIDAAVQDGRDHCGQHCQLAGWVNDYGDLETKCPSLQMPDRASAERQEKTCRDAQRLILKSMEEMGDITRQMHEDEVLIVSARQ